MSSITIGMFVLKTSQLLLICCCFGALVIAQLVAWRRKVKVLDVCLNALWIALLFARLAFVLVWLDQYRAAPLSVLDIRDGGFNLWAGLVVGAAFVAWHGWRRPPLRAPLAAGMLSFLLAWAYAAPSMRSSTEDLALPSATITNFAGEATTFAVLAQGRPVVVNLWASWCPPCRREMPILLDVQGQRKDLAFVFVNEDSNLNDALRFVAEHNMPPAMTIADPDGELMRLFHAGALPTTLLFSSDGKAVSVHVGGLSAATLESELRKLDPVTRRATFGAAAL